MGRNARTTNSSILSTLSICPYCSWTGLHAGCQQLRRWPREPTTRRPSRHAVRGPALRDLVAALASMGATLAANQAGP